MNSTIILTDTFEKKKQALIEGGIDSLHVISDFDKTLTTAFIEGLKTQSSYAMIREGGYLSPEYVKRAHALYDKYYPYEISKTLPLLEKIKKMDEWWQKHFELMVESGMNKDVIQDIARKDQMKLREGAVDFFNLLHTSSVPLLIFSAGIGDIIEAYLKHRNLLHGNTHIISNFYTFNDDNTVKREEKKFIHVFNKNETAIQDTSYYVEIKNKQNVILLGDSIGDLGMGEGLDHATVLKIGFLNAYVEDQLELYKENFDVVILNDSDMRFVVDLLQEIK